ncbi:MAG: hypothetical protein ACLQU5_20645 [Isosphaeraceae bacterium]
MSPSNQVSRRGFLNQSLAVAGIAGVLSGSAAAAREVDTGTVALYVWGVASDPLIRDGQVGVLARAVEVAKKHDLAPRYVNSA